MFFGVLFACLLSTRLTHRGILWEPETFPMAAASQMHFGHALYREIWYDKPPMAPLFYFVIGARGGWLLRLAGAVYCLGACWVSFLFASELWSAPRGPVGGRANGLLPDVRFAGFGDPAGTGLADAGAASDGGVAGVEGARV